MNTERSLFESLHAQYHPMVLQMCLGFARGDRDTANDLAQETFINTWNALKGFRGDASHKTWIYRIAVNTCLQYIRKEKNKTKLVLNDAMPSLPVHQDTDDDNQALYRAIGELGEVDRLIITMVLDELDYEEIAKVVGVNEATLRVRIHRIKQRLKKLLEYERRIG